MNNKSYKFNIIAIVIVVIFIIIGITGALLYQSYKEEEHERLETVREKQYFMRLLNSKYVSSYKSSEYDEKYWDEFIQSEYTAENINYINQYMKETYSNSIR